MNQPYPGPGLGQPDPAPAPVPPARRRRKGRLFLIIAGVLVGLIVVVVAVVNNRAPTRAPVQQGAPATITKAGTLSAIDLQEGDCYNAKQLPPAPGESQRISTVEAVPCGSPHTDQVIAKINYPADVTLAVASAGTDCRAKFQSKLAAAILKDTTYQRGRISPADEATWAKHRTVACIVATSSPTSVSLLK